MVAGMPVGGPPAEALNSLVHWCRNRGWAPLLFGIEPADLPALQGWQLREIGRQPLFVAGPDHAPRLSGKSQPARGREVRRQARRALAKGVDWTEVGGAEVWELERAGKLRDILEARWRRQPLAEFSFLVALHLAPGQACRRAFLLRSGPQAPPVGLAFLVRSDRGWLLEHQLVAEQAPNGSGELLVCRLLSSALAQGETLSLGITPLYRALVPDLPDRDVPGILSFLPVPVQGALLGFWEPLYGFRRLQLYREKLEPERWEPVYWAHLDSRPPTALLAVLRAFAGGSLIGFGLATLAKVVHRLSSRVSLARLRLMNTIFFWSLLAWIPILWHLDGEAVFGSPIAPKVWAFFDLALLAGFGLHGQALRRDRPGGCFRPFLIGTVSADALLSVISTALVHRPNELDPVLAIFLLLLNAAPIGAVVFLLICVFRRPQFLR